MDKKKIWMGFKLRAIINRVDYFRRNTKELSPISYDQKTQDQLLLLTMLGFPLKKSAYKYTKAIKKYPNPLLTNKKPKYDKFDLLYKVYFPLFKKYFVTNSKMAPRLQKLQPLAKILKKLKML